MSTQLHDAQIEQKRLLPITPATIQRVKEGVAAARDRTVRRSIQNALDNIETIAQEGCDRPLGGGEANRRASGWLRRWVMRSLIHTLFRVRVEHSCRKTIRNQTNQNYCVISSIISFGKIPCALSGFCTEAGGVYLYDF
jgi:hypothetical protein